MRHAFDHSFDHASAQGCNAQTPQWTRGGLLLLVLCFPPVLLAVWLGSVQHNWQCGTAAVRYSLAAGPRAGRPLFVLGSASGVVLVLLVVLTGGAGTAVEAFSEPEIWIILLLPEMAWAGPLMVAWMLRPLRVPLCGFARASEPSRGAFA